jgi:TetR/AcrR family tetracycline transcriptional repressor
MAKLERGAVVHEALALLDEVGLDGVSTRALARRLRVEQPSLYWHFRNKRELMAAMAAAAVAPLDATPLPTVGEDWRAWFLDNHRRFRRALLDHRDGARLHAGSTPSGDTRDRLMLKLAFLEQSGLAQADAIAGMLAASRFTVGSALEQQADPDQDAGHTPEEHPGIPTHEQAFEAGLRMILSGLERASSS